MPIQLCWLAMKTEVIREVEWDDVCVGMPVRWATPRFICYGIISEIQGEGIVISHVPDSWVSVPYGKWYFDQPHNAEEHLVVLEDRDFVEKGKVFRSPKV